jgi:hypothetical protein
VTLAEKVIAVAALVAAAIALLDTERWAGWLRAAVLLLAALADLVLFS